MRSWSNSTSSIAGSSTSNNHITIKEDTVREKIKMETNKTCMHFVCVCLCSACAYIYFSCFIIHTIDSLALSRSVDSFFSVHSVHEVHIYLRLCYIEALHTRGASSSERKNCWKREDTYEERPTEHTEKLLARALICVKECVCLCDLISHIGLGYRTIFVNKQAHSVRIVDTYALTSHTHIVCLLIFLLSSRLPCSINL